MTIMECNDVQGEEETFDSMMASQDLCFDDYFEYGGLFDEEDDDASEELAFSNTFDCGENDLDKPKGESATNQMHPPDAVGSVDIMSSLIPIPKGENSRHGVIGEAGVDRKAPPSWHSESADRPYRQTMILEIAKLLQARKKSHPSQAWLRQLPHKARKLEVRLYRSASSLEAYIDRSTLKSRLRRIAGNIIRQYSEVKKIRPSSKSRATSATSTASSLMSNFSRDSFASGASSTAHRDSVLSQSSTDSLRSLREAMLQKTSVTHAHLAAGDMRAQGQAQGEIQARSTLNPIAEGPSSHASMQHSMNIPFHTVSTFSGNDMMSSNNPDHSNTNDLERQKAVNAKLQQQIMENIRQQQEMTRRLQTVHRGSDLSMNSVGMNSRFQGSQNQRTAPFPVMPQTNMMQVGYTQGYNSMGFDGMNHQQMPNNYMNSQAAMTNSSMSSNQLRAHMAAQLSHNANIPNTLRAQMTAQLSRNQNLSAESIPIGGAFPTSSINSFPGSQMGMMGGAKSMVPNSSMPFSVMQGHQQVRPISSPLDMNSNHAPFQHSGEMPGPNSNTQKPNERDSQDGNNLSKEAYPW